MEIIFNNLKAKVKENLDNPIKIYDFSKFWLISWTPPSQVSQQYKVWWNCTQILQHSTLHENISSLYFYTEVCDG